MRPASSAFLVGLAALGLLSAAPQDPVPQKGEDLDILAPFTAYREEEKARMEEEIQGAWRLNMLETPSERFDDRVIQGFALFYDGYMALVLQGEQQVEGFLTVDQREYRLQAGIYRFQFSNQLTLQTASVMGFSNADAFDLIFERLDEPREFLVDLNERELRLNHPNGHWLVFEHMDTSIFPEEALRALERKRAGFDITEDVNREEPDDR